MYSLSVGHRRLSPIPPPLKGGPDVRGNLLPGKVCGRYRPSWAEGGGCGTERTGRMGFTPGLGLGNRAVDERKGFIGGRELLAYHPKMGR